ncbi:MAG: S-layer protein domain-containing protein, partial [Methanosarcinales archaeon]
MKRDVITTTAIAGILLLALAAIPASAVDKVEIRGEVFDEETNHVPNATGKGVVSWNAFNFAGFWYDLEEGNMSEELVIMNSSELDLTHNGEIPADTLYYNTTVQYIEYEVHEERNLIVENGLTIT